MGGKKFLKKYLFAVVEEGHPEGVLCGPARLLQGDDLEGLDDVGHDLVLEAGVLACAWGKEKKKTSGGKKICKRKRNKKKKKKNDDGGQDTPPPPPLTFGVFPDDDNVEPLEPGGHPGGVEAVDEVDVEVESFWCVL